MAAISERRVPIDRRVEPRLLARQRIGDDMRRRQRLARERALRLVELLRLPDCVVLRLAGRRGKLDAEDRVAFHSWQINGVRSTFLELQKRAGIIVEMLI